MKLPSDMDFGEILASAIGVALVDPVIRDHGFQESADMIAHPERWPRRPLLPLVNTDPDSPKFEECGVGYLLESEPTTVYVGLMFMRPENCQRAEYTSVTEMLVAGWRVDD